jgi:potassium uptake Trk family protein
VKAKCSFSFHVGGPHLNFIKVHYLYMIGFIIATSFMLYPGGLMTYADALFFAAGSSTQSSLNTIDVNTLYLYQQVVLILVAFVCNPIFINTAIVFIRLYWFEKRFEHLVKAARGSRRMKTRDRVERETVEAYDPACSETGVNGRPITVLHGTTESNRISSETATAKSKEQDMMATGRLGLVISFSRNTATAPPNASTKEGREEPEYTIVRSPPVSAALDDDDEPQKKTKQDAGMLGVPGPLYLDRGEILKALNESNEDELQGRDTQSILRSKTSSQSHSISSRGEGVNRNDDDHPVRHDTAIVVPESPARRKREQTMQNVQDDDDEVTDSISDLDRIASHLKHCRTRSHGVEVGDKENTSARPCNTLSTAQTPDKIDDPMPYLSWQPTLGRNSAFVNLTEEQRDELGGVEYCALKTLAKVLVAYYIGFHVLGMTIMLPWIMHVEPWHSIPIANGVAPVWWGIFTPASMFTDLGFTVTSDSMISFQTAVLPLLLGSFLIIVGKTGFPCMLRVVIWALSRLVPRDGALREELQFLLDHPRRCFTLLFPSKATWRLFWILVLLNTVDLVFFSILDLDDETVTRLSAGYRVLNGLFQATSTRTPGFSSVTLVKLHPAVQVSYLVMMYISVFPIAISVRRTNVYEEKSLGIWMGEEAREQDQSYVGQHLRRQLSFDLWYVFLGMFLICIVEGDKLSHTDEYAFTIFSVLFEVVSAYGTVGLSLGYPGTNTCLSTQFKVTSKLIIIAMMLRGRHRGLPYALDRAILLPSEDLHKKEAEEATRRYQPRDSMYPQSPRGEDERDISRSNSSRIRHRDTLNDNESDDMNLPSHNLATEIDSPVRAKSANSDGEETRTGRGSGFSTVSKMERVQKERSRKKDHSLGQFMAGSLGVSPNLSRHE